MVPEITPSAPRPGPGTRTFFVVGAVLLAGGCGGPGTPAIDRPASPPPGASPAPQPETVITIGNEPITWSDLRPMLGEVGGEVVEDAVLALLVREQLQAEQLSLTDADLERERELLIDQLARAAGENADDSARLLQRVQRARNLGPARFKALIDRNAGLRKLVAPGITIDRAGITREMQVRYGPKKRCRILVVAAENDARRARERLASDPADLAARFAAEARTLSIDPSAAQGGQIDPVSPADPSYSPAVLGALKALNPGELSPVIVLDRGYALVLAEGDVPAQQPPPGAETQAESDLRVREERRAMDRLAQRMLQSASVTVYDAALGWGWRNRSNGAPR